MATAKDFLQNNDNDLLIENNDFVIGNSDEDHIVDIINSAQGDWKEYVLCGVNVDNYLNSSGAQLQLKKQILSQLAQDGYSSITVNFSDNNSTNFEVDAIRS
jgi:hypothetical protein